MSVTIEDAAMRGQLDVMRACTLSDVAVRAGVTVTAVSQILRKVAGARFSEATRRRVEAAARELDYRPNFFAAQVRATGRRLAMLCVHELDDPFAGAIAGNFEHEMAERGCNLVLAALNRKRGLDFIQGAVGSHGILQLGVVGYASAKILTDKWLREISRQGVRIVTILRPSPSPAIAEVSCDQAGVLRELVARTLRPGMRRVWLLGMARRRPAPWDAAAQRGAFVARHLNEIGFAGEVVPVAVDNTGGNIEGAWQAVEQALRVQAPPDAVFCFADHHALGSMRALAARGLVVGRDVAVTGFNDQPMSAFLQPALTTVRIPVAELGRQAARVLLDWENGGPARAARVALAAEVVERESGRWAPADGRGRKA
jgi:LacI family transcriptional regulator